MTELENVNCGTIKGSVNGPYLFNLFLNDLQGVIRFNVPIAEATFLHIYSFICTPQESRLSTISPCDLVWSTLLTGLESMYV